MRRPAVLLLSCLLGVVATAPAAEPLRPLPELATGPMEIAVQERIREARGQVEALLATARPPPDALATAYGALGEVCFLYGLHEVAAVALENALVLRPDASRWRYFLAVLHADDGRFDAAAALLRELAAETPPYGPALVRLGRLELSRNRLEEAERLFREALERDPEATAARHGLGMVAAERGDPARVVEHLERVLAEQPGATAVHYPLALALRELGERERTTEHLARRGKGMVQIRDPWIDALDRHGVGSGIHMRDGNRATYLGRHAEAAAAFRRAVEAAPENLQAWKALGAALAQGGQTGEALEVYRRVLAREPDSPASHYNTGLLLAQVGHSDAALEHLRRAVELAPDYLEAYGNLAAILAETGDVAGAEQATARAIELAPGDGRLRIDHAILLTRLGRLEEAVRELERSLATPLDDPERERAASLELARLLGRLGRFADAATRYRELLETAPEHEEAYFGLAMSLVLGNREAEAQTALERAVATLPESTALRHALARLLATADADQVRDGERALALAREVMGSRPAIPHAETVAMALAELGRFEEAISWQRQAIEQARRTDPEELLPAMEQRLRRYEAGEPVRRPWGE